MTETNSIDSACQNNIEKTANYSIETLNYNPKAFTTKKKNKPNSKDSIAESLLFSIDELVTKQNLFEGKITHYSFDCPKNLRVAFNNAVKANGSSGCKNLVNYMVAYVSATMIKKTALANTFLDAGKNKETVVNVGINELSFTQNVQNRPRRLVSCNSEAVVNDPELEGRCMIGNCKSPSVDVMIYQPKGGDAKDYRVCNLHSREYASMIGWRLKK